MLAPPTPGETGLAHLARGEVAQDAAGGQPHGPGTGEADELAVHAPPFGDRSPTLLSQPNVTVPVGEYGRGEAREQDRRPGGSHAFSDRPTHALGASRSLSRISSQTSGGMATLWNSMRTTRGPRASMTDPSASNSTPTPP